MAIIDYIDDIKKWQKDFRFEIETKVRFSEVDSFNHLNNTVPFVYFEEARVEFFKELGFMQKWFANKKQIPVVADMQCNYLKQVFFDEVLKIYVKVAEMGNSSIDLHYMAVNAKEEIPFVGRGRIVHIDATTGKPEPWTEDMKRMLSNF